MRVFVLNKNRQPLDPCKPARARILLSTGKAKVYRRYPFTIILTEEVKNPVIHKHQVKIDPGSKTTGLAIVQGERVIWGSELTHRGSQIRDNLISRGQLRRSRRNRKTRYRQPRFLNRTKPKGWLAPSLTSRVQNILTWVKKLIRFCPITGISQELVRFDTQKLQNPELSGIEYQQGTLYGYELREYLLEKWNRKCAYCGATGTQLEIEHIKPLSKGGSNRVSNLTIACHSCNQAKSNQDIELFLSKKPSILKRILSQSKRPLADGASVNSTRWKLYHDLKSIGLPVEVGSGGLTKFNRCRQDLPKTHWLDAANVGKVETLIIEVTKPLLITAKGHGTRQLCRTNKYGFPIRHCSRIKFHKGFQTGDIVRAVVTKGKKIGTYVGRVATRKSGSFNISTLGGLVQGISHKYCRFIHRKDGYAYTN
ncbi:MULTISPECIES: RNA-guided endonuclease IscB [unclassified Moorena]|uniref:RNA-guided endonuclease IscB n=1 Tax=unclassified Moorena TaxID=2683338 RepID=UPI001401153C|nr:MULTISPECIES: RNA-guided endonuclease IscB [unclassified Moorena]NEO17806.1 HNH endonuclease [Moorena sp. SIO3E8]NEO46966.1 HNH endonuclease [Moorena sp. SIO4A3]NEQ04379.1 HNH endonuclease [Moorena sp. SIO3F7]